MSVGLVIKEPKEKRLLKQKELRRKKRRETIDEVEMESSPEVRCSLFGRLQFH